MEAMVRQLWLEVKGVDLGEFPIMTFAEASVAMAPINRICVTRWSWWTSPTC